jgi:hypothetical protein
MSRAGIMCDKCFDLGVIPGTSLAFATDVTLEKLGDCPRVFPESYCKVQSIQGI